MQPIPKVIRRFLDAKNAHDARALAGCFQENGHVHDEGAVHTGPLAIQKWAEGVFDSYRLQSTLLDAQVESTSTRLWLLIAGNFPGSPLRFVNDFEITDGLITSYRTLLDEGPGDTQP